MHFALSVIQDCSWFPRLRSLALDAAGAASNEDDDALSEVTTRLGRLESMMEELLRLQTVSK